MSSHVLVILSGCGVYDGAEIHESVITLLHLDRHGVQVTIAAPDVNQMHVINHHTGDQMQESRNVLIESARIARGPVTNVADVNVDQFDAVIFPGGFGTLDEMFEILTLAQTRKLSKKLLVLLYGSEYWNEVFDLRPLAEWGAISESDLDLLCRVDSAEHAFEELKTFLSTYHMVPQTAQEQRAPGIAKTRG
jgi:hypothetical protein